ncbi:MAG: type I-E CRISPR-associated protein Cas7/Cse4/CasC [Gammaproteobacteria bacterium]|nr:type I-E CRISPR-associated protein Cas7/Cse4/CasC [Gammaproteobacteria bacterium]
MTPKPHFIQIHTLHSYPAALLNRDDAGLAKRLPMGNAVRTRISSQCLKRHWRIADDRYALSGLDVPMAVRSRGTLELIRKRIIENDISETLGQTAVEALRNNKLLDASKKELKGEDALHTGQAILLGRAEIDYLVKRCTDLAREHTEEKALKDAVKAMLKEEKKNIEALKHGSGLESALFGRMVTSDVVASRDASVYVGHAFTVHEAQVENDYFTVVDDLLQESGEQGSAGIFDTELASGLYYGYVVVDVRQLVENLEGIEAKVTFARGTTEEKRELAARVVKHLLHLIATVSPGAKRGSTAPFAWAKFMLVEAGDWQPRSLASAFQDALPLTHNNKSLCMRAMERISQEIAAMDDAYGMLSARRFLSLDEVSVPQAERINLEQLGQWVEEVIRQGSC